MNITPILDFISDYNNKNGISFDWYQGYPMSRCCSFKIGGNASIAIFPYSINSFESLIGFLLQDKILFKVIGNGTNLVPSDIGFDGALLITKKMNSFSFTDTSLNAECGAGITLLAKKACELSLSGLEKLYGIPATVGGGVYMNCGAYNSQISDMLVSARCYHHEKKQIVTYSNSEMNFSYRHSRCKEEHITVLSAEFCLSRGNKDEILSLMEEVMAKRKASQPLEFPNAGSIFKRPENNFAGKLIEDAGLKGYKVGDAMVSPKHAGFIVNCGKATSDDVCELIKYIKNTVYEKSGVSLECEVEFL
ncbi:MAG: UDP-N-acetylmuramate dehydrogenase [Ruminococcaceae bacterium]|nr:UDP-N-acetylmuramate dehydrogenase [Oscillospiraceae bacterium]